MGKKSYDLGKRFEQDLCRYFFFKDYYVVYNEKGITGAQPSDLVIIKGNIATMIDCKNLENKTGIFPLSRIEFNQQYAYKRFRECGNSNFILAIKWENKVWFIDFGLLQFFDKSIDLKKIEPNIINFDEEINNVNNNG